MFSSPCWGKFPRPEILISAASQQNSVAALLLKQLRICFKQTGVVKSESAEALKPYSDL